MPMKIEVERSGGFAGMMRRRTIDTASLPAAEAARVEALARDAEREAADDGPPLPDAFVYDVAIDGRHHRVGNPRGAWQALLDAL
jgi:hypothetical protein